MMAPTTEETHALLAEIPNLKVETGVPLSQHTRFGIGGPADLFAEAEDAEPFAEALAVARRAGIAVMVIGGGTNLIVSDEGFRGLVLRFRGEAVSARGEVVTAQAGAALQDVVDFAIAQGLKGLETLSGIPGSFGAAIYGNAGAYGHSVSEVVESVLFFDGGGLRSLNNSECRFRYRESAFKDRKAWVILSAELKLQRADAAELRRAGDDILRVRNVKFPITMKCAGSIFKNLLFSELPATAAAQIPPSCVRDGKVPAAWFLEQTGAKGLSRGGIHVAEYHANLIYNSGEGTADELRAMISELKRRVRERFGIEIEEEVQYVGF